LNWYISLGVEGKFNPTCLTNNIIGIDLGIKQLVVCSDGNLYDNINKSIKVKKITKKLKQKQRKLSKKYECNKDGNKFIKTNNIRKLEKSVLKTRRSITNIQTDHLHKITTEIVERKPNLIVLENLNVKGMLKNHNLARAIQEQSFNKFKSFISYKAKNKGIEVIEADRFYPSSKLCSGCGVLKEDLKLKDRIYKCECGLEINRDVNASYNLRNLGNKYRESHGNISLRTATANADKLPSGSFKTSRMNKELNFSPDRVE
jgi:putative transposase